MSTWREEAAVYQRLREFIANLGTCTASPRPSCSRPDGTPLRHWAADLRGAWSFGDDNCEAKP